MKKRSDFREIKQSNKEEKYKVIILAGFSDKQVHSLINLYKKNKLPKTIFATVTNKSKEFKLKTLLKELKREHKAIKNI
ncbi:MAG: DUF3783 domain-containing protein [Nanoarchaeota archaeon]